MAGRGVRGGRRREEGRMGQRIAVGEEGLVAGIGGEVTSIGGESRPKVRGSMGRSQRGLRGWTRGIGLGREVVVERPWGIGVRRGERDGDGDAGVDME